MVGNDELLTEKIWYGFREIIIGLVSLNVCVSTWTLHRVIKEWHNLLNLVITESIISHSSTVIIKLKRMFEWFHSNNMVIAHVSLLRQ